LALEVGNPFLATSAIELLAGLQIYHQGDLYEAASALEEVLALGAEPGGGQQPFTATAHALLAEIYLEWNDLPAAAVYLEKGIELAERGGIAHGLIHTYCAQARLRQALGDRDGARRALRSAGRALDANPMRHFLVHHLACRVQLALWLGEREKALQWAQGDPTIHRHPIPEKLPTYLREVQAIALARVRLARGETDQVLAIAERWRPAARTTGRRVQLLELELLEALALEARGETTAALESFRRCLSLGEPEGFIRSFIESGESVKGLLRRAASRGVYPAYAGQLLGAYDAPRGEAELTPPEQLSPSPSSAESPALVEPLTPRESEVLALICQGLTNRQIAERLVVTLSTVKKHTGNIYGKLQVRGRTQAIVRAQELGLHSGR
jgi:LuxR family maltose regulon positive regulatory protein